MIATPARVAVLATEQRLLPESERIANALGLEVLAPATNPAECAGLADALLLVESDGLALLQTGPGAPGPVRVDFGGAAMRHRRRGGHNELLGRAVGVRAGSPLQVMDATAGLGRDAFVLADLGCSVLLRERHPAVAMLLADALGRAAVSEDDWLAGVAARMELAPLDPRTESLPPGVEVIYLDPMFPARQKSAAVKKEMALFHRLLGDTGDEQDSAGLLQWALQQSVARVVVKRPPKAPVLAQRTPSHQISGKAVRFDVHVLRAR